MNPLNTKVFEDFESDGDTCIQGILENADLGIDPSVHRSSVNRMALEKKQIATRATGRPIYVCAGITHSGSTWLFNAMRLVLERRYRNVYSTWIGDRNPAVEESADVTLIKVHNQNDKLANEADVILTSHRDPRDIIASMLSAGGSISDRHTALWLLQNCRSAYEFWAPLSEIDFAYMDIIHNDEECVRRIAVALNVELSEATIQRIVKELRHIPNNRYPDEKHDPEFLTHVNHHTDGRDGLWKDQLPAAVVQSTLSEHRDWIEKLGYSID